MTSLEARYAAARAIGVAEDDLPRPPDPRRLLDLEGAMNFRDLGGYPTTDGGRVAWSMLFRSAHLNTLTDTDLARVESLGLRTVHDFRLPKERERQPSRLPQGVDVVLHAMSDNATSGTMVDIMGEIVAGRAPLPDPSFWDDNYEHLAIHAQPMVTEFVTNLADPAGTTSPALFHCSGGKDRTGLAGVVLLQLLGVDRDTAIDDFLLTNIYRTPQRAESMREQLASAGLTAQELLPILGVTRSAIERALSVIDHTFGGVEAYVVDAGLGPEGPARLRARFVEH